MQWIVLWSVLVVGTLVGAFFLGRSLWRRGKALLAELDRASQVMGELAEASARLAEQAETAARAVEPTDPFDAEEARRRWRAVGQERAARTERRAERHERTYARWRALTR